MENMRVQCVNTGNAETISHGERDFLTGINKHAAGGSVFIGVGGIKHDAVVDTEHHGGPDQAIYVYRAEDYAWWSEQLGKTLVPGTFGENLTIDGLPTDMRTGDRLLIGDLILEATSPRIPCATLSAQMQDKDFVLSFRRAERPGTYVRVLNEGEVCAGDRVTYVENPEMAVTILEQFRLYYSQHANAEELQRAIDAPIAERIRARFQKTLASS